MSLIRLHNISRSFNGRPVLKDIFFRLGKGDRVGLIGKNGVGKTTALKLVLGQDDPDRGTVEIDKELKIGYFSQFSELTDDATVLEILEDLFSDIHLIEEELSPFFSQFL